MTKKMCSLLLLLLAIPLVSSINFDMNTNFRPSETLIASLEGNFYSPIISSNIEFISDRVSVPLTFDIAQIEGKYYIYAQLPLKEANYTLLIKNVHYYENGQEFYQDIERNFTVSGNISDFTVSPGFIITRGNFTLTLESMNQALDISLVLLNDTQTVHIPLAQSKKVQFSVSSETSQQTTLTASSGNSSYSIPIFILGKNSTIVNESNISIENETQNGSFVFTSSLYNVSVNENSPYTLSIYLKNLGDSDINNIKLSVSSDLRDRITLPGSINLSASSAQEIDLVVLSTDTGTFTGQISALSDDFLDSSDFFLISLPNDTFINRTGEKQTCAYYGGDICGTGTECTGTVISALEGDCCIGTCAAKVTSSSTGMIIGIILLAVIVIGGGIFYWKSRAKKPSATSLLKKKTDELEKKVLGPETRGSLSKS